MTNWMSRAEAKLWAAFSLAAVGVLTSCSSPQPLPQLFQGLSRPTWHEELAQRLRDRFPVGSPEAKLIHELWAEGFLPKTAWDAPQREAVFDDMGHGQYFCRRTGEVSWSADRSGRLTSVSGQFDILNACDTVSPVRVRTAAHPKRIARDTGARPVSAPSLLGGDCRRTGQGGLRCAQRDGAALPVTPASAVESEIVGSEGWKLPSARRLRMSRTMVAQGAEFVFDGGYTAN
jgi:hypothetical protein